jgi:hypothetical protein
MRLLVTSERKKMQQKINKNRFQLQDDLTTSGVSAYQ